MKDIIFWIIVAVLFLAAASQVMAQHHNPEHTQGLYDAECCNDHDCSPITKMKIDGPIITFSTKMYGEESFTIDTSKVAASRLRPSKDHRAHACVRKMLDGSYYVICMYFGGPM